MTQKICDCGKPANETGYCESCYAKVQAQIAKEMRHEEISLPSDYYDQVFNDMTENPEPIDGFHEGRS